MTFQEIAKLFHENCARLSLKYGYTGQGEWDPASPNGKLWIEVCREVFSELSCSQFRPCRSCEHQIAFKVGDKVVKNPDTWFPSEFDAWGAGEGVGEVVELFYPGVGVRWPAGIASHQNCELALQ